MLILLPPSETKRPGGSGRALDIDSLALSSLAPQRRQVIDALVALSADAADAVRILKLGARHLDDVAANATLRTAPTRRAIDRYTGVLYDALDAATLDAAARRWLGAHVLIHSAPFGPVGALDPIPAYRLAAGTALPGVPPLRRIWADAVAMALRDASPSFVLDLRSEAYAALGPIPDAVPSAYVRVMSRDADGQVRALNHFNKRAKGALVRGLAQERPRVRSLAALLQWAQGAGVLLREAASGTLELLV